MKRIDAYIFKILIKYVLIVQFFIALLAMFVSALSRMEDIKKHGGGLGDLVIMELLSLPSSLMSSMPIAIVVASIISIMLLMRSNELLAYVSLGGRIQRLMIPFIVVAIVSSATILYYDFNFYPKLRHQVKKYESEKIRNVKYHGRGRLVDVWLIGEDRSIMNIGLLDPIDNYLSNVKQYMLDENEIVYEVRDIDSISYIDGKWKYSDIIISDVRSYPPKVAYLAEYFDDSTLLNELTSISGKHPKELSPKELFTAVKALKERGHGTIKYEMLIGTRIAEALSVIVLVLLIVPVGINFSRNYSPIKSAFISLIIGGIFWGVLAGANSLGYAGVLPVPIASYGTHVLFFLASIILLRLKEMVN